MIIKQSVYDGSFIKRRFAYEFFRKNVSPTGNIVAFRAPMVVTQNLIDLEDSLEDDFIYSDDAINFCWEIPNLCPLGAVAFQRLFNTTIANHLHQFIGLPIEMRGDDLMVIDTTNTQGGGKASVSITYSKDNVAIGHTGINIHAGKRAPDFAFSTELSDEYCELFMQAVCNSFEDISRDLFVATAKVIV